MDNDRTPKPDKAKNYSNLSGVGLTQPALNRLYQLHKHFIDGVRNGRRLVLRSCDLRKLDFTDMDLRDSELISCDFSSATLGLDGLGADHPAPRRWLANAGPGAGQAAD